MHPPDPSVVPRSVAQAEGLARELARTPAPCFEATERPVRRALAIGDPQAPLRTFLQILAGHDALGEDGRLRPDLRLVSLGDHFDWGRRDQRRAATDDALALLAWLSAHAPDQVALLIGNHDLGRVGELAEIDQPTFEAAHAEAARIYDGPPGPGAEETAFCARYPCFPTAEVAARDFAAFSVEQRTLVSTLLRRGRLVFAEASGPDLLLNHAGVTRWELAALGLPQSVHSDAHVVAQALNAALADAVRGWTTGPLRVPHLHQPGSAATGEGGGALYHRPADPTLGAPAEFTGPSRRRYDPRHLPHGLTQAIGHIRDAKCRALMPGWSDDARPTDGILRSLLTDGRAVGYGHGLRDATGLRGIWFLDAGMQHVSPGDYPLLDLNTRSIAARI